jgi:hypothetical protein
MLSHGERENRKRLTIIDQFSQQTVIAIQEIKPITLGAVSAQFALGAIIFQGSLECRERYLSESPLDSLSQFRFSRLHGPCFGLAYDIMIGNKQHGFHSGMTFLQACQYSELCFATGPSNMSR